MLGELFLLLLSEVLVNVGIQTVDVLRAREVLVGVGLGGVLGFGVALLCALEYLLVRLRPQTNLLIEDMLIRNGAFLLIGVHIDLLLG